METINNKAIMLFLVFVYCMTLKFELDVMNAKRRRKTLDWVFSQLMICYFIVVYF